MMDLSGGGRRSPPNLRSSAGGGVPLADGRSSRSSGSGGCLSHGSDGRFCSLSRSSDEGIEDRPVVDAHGVPLGVDDGFLAGDHDISPNLTVFVKNNVFSSATGVSTFPATCNVNVLGAEAGCHVGDLADVKISSVLALSALGVPGAALMASSDKQMTETGLLHLDAGHVKAKGVNTAMQVDAGHVMAKEINSAMLVKNLGVNEDCGFKFSTTNTANLPSSSFKFCLGAEASPGSLHKAPQNLPQGVCGNVSANFCQPASISPNICNMFNGDSRSGGAWQRPKVIPMAPISELGIFSKDAIDEEEINVTVKKFETAIVGRMFGKKFRIPSL